MYRKMATDVECRECMNCQLICSLTHDGSFNPSKARITIPGRRFKDNCIEGCTLCVKYCPYGAIALRQV